MFRIIVVGQVLQDTAGLEDIDRLAVGKSISYGGNTAIGVDFTEPWLLLLILLDGYLVDFIREAVGVELASWW